MASPEGDLPPGPGGAVPAVARPETAAEYLAKCLIADHRFVPGTLAEAAPLAEACDLILTGGDGVGLTIACIIDRDADRLRRFTLPAGRVDEIAAACRKHVGSVYGVKDAVTIEIWEVGQGVPDPDDRARLEGYAFRRVTRKGVAIRGYAVDPVAAGGCGALFATAADGAARQAWIQRIFGGPRRSDAELRAAAQQHEQVARFDTRPLATYALLAVFAVMFVIELAWPLLPGDGASPSVGTLIALGGLQQVRVEEAGEWWRMLTCAFLHGGVMHLVFNGVAMFMAGGVLENLIGRRWMLALFVIGALGGSAMSMAVNDDLVTSVGASGAIMALLAAAMIASFRLPAGPARMQILVSLGQILIPGLLPLATSGGDKVDFGAHLGGALTGAAAGLLLLATWPREAPHPRGARLAGAIAAVGLAIAAYGVVRVAIDRPEYARLLAGHAILARDPQLAQQLVPDAELPRDEASIVARTPELLARYPRDPRLHYFTALIALDADDVPRARAHAEQALAERDLRHLLTNVDGLEVQLRFVLAQIHDHEGEPDRARAVIRPGCAAARRVAEGEVKAYFERACASHVGP